MQKNSKKAAALVAMALVCGTSFVFADVAVPNTFVAGTPIKAADVNANFAALNTGKQDKLVVFTHVASAANTSQNYTTIDNPATNGDPNALLVVTPNRTPPGGTTVFYYGSTSVQYTAENKWAILHDKGPTEPIAAGEAFNVLVVKR